jgi:hypothetical protein
MYLLRLDWDKAGDLAGNLAWAVARLMEWSVVRVKCTSG